MSGVARTAMTASMEQTGNAPPVPSKPLQNERSQIVAANGLKLLCREWGSPEHPTIVLLHGLRGFSATWRTLAAAISTQFHLVALDQRGRGDSDWDPDRNYYTDAYLADLEVVGDHFRLGNFFLLGHSMGGTTAYVYADRHPTRVRALIIEDIAPGSSTEGAGAARIVAEMSALPDHFPSWAEARAYWRAQRPTLSSEAIEQRVAESLREGGDGRISWRYDAAGIRATRLNPDSKRIIDLWPVIERLSMPTRVIHGECSDFCAPSTVMRMKALNARIESVAVPAAGHYVHDDAPEPFVRHVREFLCRQS